MGVLRGDLPLSHLWESRVLLRLEFYSHAIFKNISADLLQYGALLGKTTHFKQLSCLI